MKFILSHWIGFEIDSSEFAASVHVRGSPYKRISAFLESPYIEHSEGYFTMGVFYNLGEAYNKAKKRLLGKARLALIRVSGKKFENYITEVQQHINFERESDSEYDGVYLSTKKAKETILFIRKFLRFFPFLSHKFYGCLFYFEFKCMDKQTDEIKEELKLNGIDPDRISCGGDSETHIYRVSLVGNHPTYRLGWADEDYWRYVHEKIKNQNK